MGNDRVWGLLRHLVTRSQAASYRDGTTREGLRNRLFFPAHVSL